MATYSSVEFNLELTDDSLGYTMGNLPQILPYFSIPQLTEKPQNPIMDTLKLASAHKYPPPSFLRIPDEPTTTATNPEHKRPPAQPEGVNNIWRDAMTRDLGVSNQALSWDRLRSSYPSGPSFSSFLSEQESLVFGAARYHILPPLHDPTTEIVYVPQQELLAAFRMTVLGISSVLHTWDASAEKFVQSNVGGGRRGFLLVDGKDEIISQSLISRFLTIGTLLRRLETFLGTLRSRPAREGPTVHAYAHTLSTIASFLRNALILRPPLSDQSEQQHFLSAIWMHYGKYEDILVALSALYGRDEDKTPQDYSLFDPLAAPLLSRVYAHLNTHLERQSDRVIIAILAFILTSTSHEYIQQVSRSVGYGHDRTQKVSHVVGERPDQYFVDDDDGDDKQDDVVDTREMLEDTFPTFFPPELLDILPAAQKSLILLRTARPDHPLLKRTAAPSVIRWFWTEAEIEAAWSGTSALPNLTSSPVLSGWSHSQSVTRKADFYLFEVFDLEPGSNIGSTSSGKTNTSSLQTFIDSFPERLPPITPTLSHLTSLVFADLVQHASTLSTALLSLFLSKSDHLNLEAHLLLLRSYLLLTAPLFKSRLSAALFSDLEYFDQPSQAHSTSIRSLRRRPHTKTGVSSQPWAVGLAPTLLERETWPPVGADLSFFLRTVIVDSFETGKKVAERDIGGQKVLEEAEYRLGFAIRDLPVGRDKWLSPLSIEALDFLYMDYKPPHPLEVLITPEILSKYQRMFAFIIRLMRVESALNAFFRMTRLTSEPLFPTLVSSRRLMLRFRFVAHSFVSNLSGYVFDTAIGGNFDPFIAQLSPSPESTVNGGRPSNFSDVFSLAKSHSRLLDNILSACLLRSGQRGVGELLRHSLELILEFTVGVGELYRKRTEEYQASVLLEGIARKFYAKMTTLIKVLKGLVDKNPSALKPPSYNSISGDRHIQKPTGGADALYHLLIRLDLGDWWSTAKH